MIKKMQSMIEEAIEKIKKLRSECKKNGETTLTMKKVRAALEAHFICPISQDLPKNPVISKCGHIFERKHIDDWLARPGRYGRETTCPSCRQNLGQSEVFGNKYLEQIIDIIFLDAKKDE
jgi:hypothetical protein